MIRPARMSGTGQPTVSLRLADAGDISFLSSLARDPAVEPFLAVGSGDEEALRALLREPGAERGPDGLFVICADGEAAGGLALQVVNRRSRICELSHLMVRPDRRGAGVASAAVTLACRTALVEHGMHRIQLEVYEDNVPGQALFSRVGFVREGARRRAYWRRERWLDGVQFGMLDDELELPTA